MKIVVVGGSGPVDGEVGARRSSARTCCPKLTPSTMDLHWWSKLFSLRLRLPPLRRRSATSKHLAHVVLGDSRHPVAASGWTRRFPRFCSGELDGAGYEYQADQCRCIR